MYETLWRVWCAVHTFPQSLHNIATAARVETDQAAEALMDLVDRDLIVVYDHCGVGTQVWELSRG